MNSPDNMQCQAGCSHCSASEASPVTGEDIFIGWRLGVAAMWVFLLPLALAVAGAVISRHYWPGASQMLALALAGLVLGVLIASIASRFIRTTHTDSPVEPVYTEHDRN